jgi:hypothetical protein
MCGASSPVSLTSSPISQRGMLRLYFNTAIICPSRVTVLSHSPTLSWSHDTQICAMRNGSQLHRAHLPRQTNWIAFLARPRRWAKRSEELQKPGGVVGDTEPLQRARNPDSAVETQCRVKVRPETPENDMRKEHL